MSESNSASEEKRKPASFLRLEETERCFAHAQMEDEMARVQLVDGQLATVTIPRQMTKVREDQVQNAAGGYVFQVSDETLVRRFLIMGTEGGTFYVTEEELTLEAVKGLVSIIEKGKASMILKEMEAINRDNRNPKMTSMLFALALCSKYHTHDADALAKSTEASLLVKTYSEYIRAMHREAIKLIPAVCRIPTHLFEFVGNCETIAKGTKIGQNKSSSGWGRSMRMAISKWYTSKTAEKLAMFMTKYPQRGGWSHRDLFRLAHPELKKGKSDFNNSEDRLELEQIFRFAVKGDLQTRKRRLTEEELKESDPKSKYSDAQMDKEEKSSALSLIETYLKLKQEKSEEVIVEAIKKNGLVREHLPTDSLKSKLVWKALLDVDMPMTAMIRNLGKMSEVECLDEDRVVSVCEKLDDVENLRKARIHPMTVLLAKSIYERGRGLKGNLEWKVEPRIVDALESAFYKAFINAPPTNKRYLVAMDVSGSMTQEIGGGALSCREAATAMSLILLHNETQVKFVAFCDVLTDLPFTKKWRMKRINDHINGMTFGSTDCSLPILHAIEKNLEIDVFVVYTDNDTWAGHVHPFEALKQYREHSGIQDARLIVMGMTGHKFTIADPTDKGMLDICGFDSAVSQIIGEFINGNI